MKIRNGSRWPVLLLPALLLAVACGVPISAEEVTATAESARTSQQLSTIGEAAVSSRGSSSSAASIAASPISTLAALSTPGASETPNPSATAGASATPGASTTPNVTTTPDASATPGASATPEVGLLAATTGTPDATATSEPAGTPTVQPTPGVPTSGFGAEVVNLVNEYRVSKGLPRLRADPYITTASNNYAHVMATERGNVASVSHTGPDGSTSEQRLAASGYGGAFCGENLAAGQVSPQAAVDVWKSSPAHNAIMLAANPTEIGVGYYYNPSSHYKHYWVLMTGRVSDFGCAPS